MMLDRACDSWCHAGWERRHGGGRLDLLLSRRGWTALGARDDGRFLGKHIAQDGEEVEDGRLLLAVSSVHFEHPNVTHIPKSSPSKQVWVVDLALGINVLPWPHHHVFGRRHVDQGCFAGVGVGYP